MLGYASCHQLFVLQLYKLSFICSFIHDIDYSVIIYLQFIMLVLCTHHLYAREPSPFLTHSLGCFSDDPEFARPGWIFSSIVQVFDETVHVARS